MLLDKLTGRSRAGQAHVNRPGDFTKRQNFICSLRRFMGGAMGYALLPSMVSLLMLWKISAHSSAASYMSLVRTRGSLDHGLAFQRCRSSHLLSYRGGATSSESTTSPRFRIFLAVGSNLGDRFQNIVMALDLLCEPGDHGTRHCRSSFLHQTQPMYVVDQPSFLNGVVEIETNLKPNALLSRVKWVEEKMGRDFSEVRNGPRPVDLDLLFCDRIDGSSKVPIILDTPTLIVPHCSMQDRAFVLSPLAEVAGSDYKHPIFNATVGNLLERLQESEFKSMTRVLCLPRGRFLHFNQTIVMGILNVTPDSFSDGGMWSSTVDVAVRHALKMEEQGAGIIDIGGESTRPGAREISVEEQIRRTIPVIKEIRKFSDIPISIDTRHSRVAKAAVEAGADMVNDVSGGIFDKNMFDTVARLRVPIVLMHMRGNPESMQTLTEYDSVVDEVIESLLERSRAAESAGIPRWLQLVDPGIGFSKDLEGNLLLLKNLALIRKGLGDLPIVLGTSRKGFIGNITGITSPEERDYGSVGSCITALCLGGGPLGCNIVRVHNVKGSKEALVVMNAISEAK